MTEHQLHVQVAKFLDWALIAPTVWTSFDAGAGKLSPAAAGRRKARGVKAGWPDLMVFALGLPPIGIELKAEKGGLSPVQRVIHGELTLAGVRTYVAKSVDHVASILRESGIPLRTRLS